MKKVKKADLHTLIFGHYLNIVKNVPILYTGKQPCDTIQVDVDSVSINVYDKNEFDSRDDQETMLNEFAKRIEKMTFENLKVVDMGCERQNGQCFTWAHIANAYEVID